MRGSSPRMTSCHMTIHLETQSDLEEAVHALIKRDPRLKQSDPNSRSTCKRAVANNSFGVPTATLTCQNTTLAQLADKLPAMAPAYVDHPALDASGLEGGFDFALSWTPRGNSSGL